MTNILVTGSNGQLGSDIRDLSIDYPDFNFFFTDVDELNITNIDELNAFFSKNTIDLIVNCAAYTAVDKAETDKENAFLLNAIAVDMLIEMAQNYNAALIHVSTDYVFDGEKNVPYSEDDATFPATAYGETKYEGEKLILYSNIKAAIIRTSWLYSSHGNNFVKTMLRLGKEKDSLKVVFDQVGTPTYSGDLAKAILDIAPQLLQKESDFKEVYHFSNEGVCSWYDFSINIFKIKNIHCNVTPVLSEEFPTPARRPAYSVLNKSKIKSDFNLTIPYWTDSLELMLSKLE